MEWEPPETHVAWREEVGIVGKDSLVQDEPKDLLEAYPLKPHELLRDRSDRVVKHLTLIADRHPDKPVWLVDDDGSVETFTIQELANKNNKDRINHHTLLLPPEVGGLEGGLLNGKSPNANDVADEFFADAEKTVRCRTRRWNDDRVPAGMRLVRTIDTRPEADDTEEESASSVQRYWHWYELLQAGETEGSQSASRPVHWQPHTDDVASRLRTMVDKLGLSDELQTALCLAGKFHDLGKKRELWQRSIGNPNPSDWLAKSGSRAGGLEITPYRHEFGSLLDLVNKREFQDLPGDMKDLVLHLVAAHHGRARPHFPLTEAFDPERPQCEADAMVAKTPRRFARLQRKYGRWGLAYLESLLRAADWAASSQPSELVTETEEVSQ
jgi:CRISPR-associated endonuclease/helicase Cas3